MTTLRDTVRVNGQAFVTVDQASGGGTRLATTTSPVGRQTIVRTDSLGRVVMARGSGLDSVRYRYDTQGRLDQLTDGGRVVSYTYDTSGRLQTTTDPIGRTDRLFYDLADRLTGTKTLVADAWRGYEDRITQAAGAGGVAGVTLFSKILDACMPGARVPKPRPHKPDVQIPDRGWPRTPFPPHPELEPPILR